MNAILEFLGNNGPLLAMLAITLVVIPTLVVFGNEAFNRWLQHKEKMAEALNAQAAEKAAQYAAHTERLEQRMRVVERIITDRGIDIADEIDKLRDDTATPLN